MKKYNRDKRATYNAHARKINTHDSYDAHDAHDRYNRIHIDIRYDGQARTTYTQPILRSTHSAKRAQVQKYVGIPNAVNDIFPEINAPHNAHIYRGTAPYKRFIAQETDYTRPIDMDDYTHTNTKRVKCVIFNAQDKMIYYGVFTRTRAVNYRTHETHITLHRADRSIEVRAYIPTTDKIHGVDIKEIYRHGIELYHI